MARTRRVSPGGDPLATPRRGASSARLPTWAAVTVLLIIAIGGTLWVPIYARSTPKLGDFPFFYWYQLIWVPVVAFLTWLCYLLRRTRPAPGSPPGDGRGVRR